MHNRKWKHAVLLFKTHRISALWGGNVTNSSRFYDKVLGVRWRGVGGDPGFPHVGKNETWMPVPDFTALPLLEEMAQYLKSRPEDGEPEEVEKAIAECRCWEVKRKAGLPESEAAREIAVRSYRSSSWYEARIIFDNDWFSAIWGTNSNYYSTNLGRTALGIRWNGGVDDKGYPCSFGHKVYFIVPDIFTIPFLKALQRELEVGRGSGSLEMIEKAIEQCSMAFMEKDEYEDKERI